MTFFIVYFQVVAALCLYLHLKSPYEREPLLTSVSAIFWGYTIALLVIVVAGKFALSYLMKYDYLF